MYNDFIGVSITWSSFSVLYIVRETCTRPKKNITFQRTKRTFELQTYSDLGSSIKGPVTSEKNKTVQEIRHWVAAKFLGHREKDVQRW